MELTPAAKVFLYMVTMEDAEVVCEDTLWHERYRITPKRMLRRLQRRHYLTPVLAGFELTDKGRASLTGIDDWLWIHQYYLPGIIDFDQAKHLMNKTRQVGYALMTALLDRAQQTADGVEILLLLLRQRVKLEFQTHHDREALHTLMALIYHELDWQPEPTDLSWEDFHYSTSWVKLTAFEKLLLTQLLGRLDQTVDDFEMSFGQWLQPLSSRNRFFTNFEVMTIVMYELGNDANHLELVYRQAAQRHQQQCLQPSAASELN